MRIPSCLSRLLNPRLLQNHPEPATPSHIGRRSKGQVLVIFAMALVALLLFAGLAVDAGVLYVSYGHLKRSLDASAVAAANNFKRGQNTESMKAAALEVLTMNNVDVSQLDLKVYICDGTIFDPANPTANLPDGIRDDVQLSTLAPNFHLRCPDTASGESPRKMVYLDAKQHTPF